MILSRVGCDKSRLVALVLVGTGSAGTGDPFVEVVAKVGVGWALRVLGPGRKGACIREMIRTTTGLTTDGLWYACERV